MNKEAFPAPGIVAIEDGSGNKCEFDPDTLSNSFTLPGIYRPGDTVNLKITMNEFSIEYEYEAIWKIQGRYIGEGTELVYVLQEEDISINAILRCKVTSTKNKWHRRSTYDHSILVILKIAPGI